MVISSKSFSPWALLGGGGVGGADNWAGFSKMLDGLNGATRKRVRTYCASSMED